MLVDMNILGDILIMRDLEVVLVEVNLEVLQKKIEKPRLISYLHIQLEENALLAE